mmetsp:Transcript_3241/g.6779  ORF Transcript_3241/g.6779 Transcript_3241/m.6779 type:complete len:555 (-) Transcript_3241:96-1760(-)
MSGDSVTEEKKAIPFALLAPLAFVQFVDSVSYMVTAPSIVFYVLENGGSLDMYGLVLASFSFSSFCAKPVLGYFCDAGHGKFRTLYLISLGVAALGGLTYFAASAFPSKTALILLLLGRILGGVGAANSTLGFTYIAHVVDKSVFTQATSLLSLVRIVGMAIAPAFNVLLNDMNFSIDLFGYNLEVTPLNAVGLFLALFNTIAIVGMIFLFVEPDTAPHDDKKGKENDAALEKQESGFWASLFSMEIVVPVLSIFQMNANFQLIETGLAPAANDSLGWGPVGISAFFGAQSICIFVAILITFDLSRRGVKDETLLLIGLIFAVIGNALVYFLWTNPTTPILFFIPVVVACLGFPFSVGPTRSLFTKSCAKNSTLSTNTGSMQAMLSMDASIAGFLAPGFISAFVLRTPEQVEASSDNRELTAWALYAPALSLITLAGHVFVTYVLKAYKEEEEDDELENLPSETTDLLGEKKGPKHQLLHFNSRTQSARLHSASIMGIPQITYDEFESNRKHAALRRKSTGGMNSATVSVIQEASESLLASSKGKPNYRASSYV